MLTPDSFNGRRRCRSRHSRYRMAIEHHTPNPHPVTRAIRSPRIPDNVPTISANKESSLIASRLPGVEPATPLAFPTAGESSSHGRQATPKPHPLSRDRDTTVTLTWTFLKNYLSVRAVSLCGRVAPPPSTRHAVESSRPPSRGRRRTGIQESSQPEEGLRHCILQAIPRRLAPWRNPLRAGAH